MATTPKGIVYPTTGDTLTPLANRFASLATSADQAIANSQTQYIGTNAQRLALTAPDLREGITWYATDTDIPWTYDGTAWYQNFGTFTPAWTGLTLGNGTVGGWYRRTGKVIDFQAWFVMGSTSTMGTGLSLTLPIAPALSGATWDSGFTANVNRGGSFFAPLTAVLGSATAPHLELYALNAAGSYLSYNGITPTIPGTWGSGARLSVAGTYLAA